MRKSWCGVVCCMGCACLGASAGEPALPKPSELLAHIDEARARFSTYRFTVMRKTYDTGDDGAARHVLTSVTTVSSDGRAVFTDDRGVLVEGPRKPHQPPIYRTFQLTRENWSKRMTTDPSANGYDCAVTPPLPDPEFQGCSPLAALFEIVERQRRWIDNATATVTLDEKGYVVLEAPDPHGGRQFMRLVLDRGKGYIPIRSEIGLREGFVLHAYECLRFRTADNVVWVPTRYRRTVRLTADTPTTVEVNVPGYSLGDTSILGPMELPFPQGSTVRDGIAGLAYRIEYVERSALPPLLARMGGKELPPALKAQVAPRGYLAELQSEGLEIQGVGTMDEAPHGYSPLAYAVVPPAAVSLFAAFAWQTRRVRRR